MRRSMTRSALLGAAILLGVGCDGYVVGTTGFTPGPLKASQLVFVTQPSDAAANTVISPAIRVAVEDVAGQVVTADTSTVTVIITGGTGASGANLLGTSTVQAVNGIATFSNLAISLAGTGYTLTASNPSFTKTSAAFTIN